MNPMYLTAERLTAAAFKPYGDVIAPSNAASCFPINEGSTTRFHDICRPDIEALDDGCVGISIFAGKAFHAPVALRLMERHPLASQAFMPLSGNPYLVIVASGNSAPAPGQIRAFLATDGQGVNYHKGTWHHPLVTLEVDAQFLVIDRIGTRQNYEEVVLTTPITVFLPAIP